MASTFPQENKAITIEAFNLSTYRLIYMLTCRYVYTIISLSTQQQLGTKKMNEEMKVEVTVKNHYGNELVYPVCNVAQYLCELAGTKTFTEANIRICKKLGYEFEIVMPRSWSI
jgi:hypothetical protein